MTDDATTPPRRIRSVLFVCNQNAIRSPIAEALAKRYARGRIFVESVGLTSGSPDPFTVAVMEELGIDVSRHQPAKLDDIDASEFDLFVALTPQAQKALEIRGCGKLLPPEYWPVEDPSETEGRRDQRIEAYRRLRDDLDRRIRERFKF